MLTRRRFLQASAATGVAVAIAPRMVLAHEGGPTSAPAGTLPADDIPKFATPLVIPPQMPRTGKLKIAGGQNVDVYDIAVRQFTQQIVPASMGLAPTTVWGYGSVEHPETFNYPSFTIESKHARPTRIRWRNELVDGDGHFLPHLLPVDQTLHWANPPGGTTHRDHVGHDPDPYRGPVPIVTHVHGAHTHEESDGYAEAWYLPDARDIPAGYAAHGTWYEPFRDGFRSRYGVPAWAPGTATFQYPNDQRATTLWYHDHTLGMTRANVYAGPAGFYLLRGGPDDEVIDRRTGGPATLPGPAPVVGSDPFGTFYEIPLAIQDRTFALDGSLWYPADRAFFEGLSTDDLDIPTIPEIACDGSASDVPPIWNPEFFGTTMLVNGRTWPYLDVERRRYRFRLLNGCNSRFLYLQFEDPRVTAWQIGAEGGFLSAPVPLAGSPADGHEDGTAKILLAPAERADVIVDFSDVPSGSAVLLRNLGPDEPFGGFPTPAASPDTTGLVMQFRVGPRRGRDASTPPDRLVLPAIPPIDPAVSARYLSLNEADSSSVRIRRDDDRVTLDCDREAEVFGPVMATLGTLDAAGRPVPLHWMDAITEDPVAGTTETWAFYNFTADAHPIHIHQVQFQVVDRQPLATIDGMTTVPATLDGDPRPPEPWETGFKDTVVAYPGEVTRVQARFDLAGLYVWHCHIVEHEDNEMMRPFRVGS